MRNNLPTTCLDDNMTNLVSSLTFDQYVLIGCLNLHPTKNLKNGTHEYLYCDPILTFVATSKQGFLNVFNELSKQCVRKRYQNLEIYNNQLLLRKSGIIFVIKYAVSEQRFKELINLPGLDFYKCYYDGVKIHCTPEAIRCHKTNELQYDGKITLIPIVAKYIFRHCDLKFKDKFWKYTNKEYIGHYSKNNELIFNFDIFESERYDGFSKFLTKDEIKNKKAYFGSKYVITIDEFDFEQDKERLYEFIEEIIFENPINSLC
jgi:hypothetical protein